MSNCGLPNGAVHMHAESCYRGGRQDALAPFRALANLAVQNGRQLDPQEVLDLVNAPVPRPVGTCRTSTTCNLGYQHQGDCDA